MRNFKLVNILFFVFITTFFTTLYADATNKDTNTKESAEEFLDIARRNIPVDTWSILDGNLTHKRKGSSTKEANIRCGTRFYPTRMISNVSITELDKDRNPTDSTESYNIGQTYDGKPASIIGQNSKKDKIELFEYYGISPEDFTNLLTVYKEWDLIEELASSTFKGFKCRVFKLQNPHTKEVVNVYIFNKYYSIAKIESFKTEDSKTPYRIIEIDGFKVIDDLGAPSKINIYGPDSGWRTRIDFSDIRLGKTENGVPADIFAK